MRRLWFFIYSLMLLSALPACQPTPPATAVATPTSTPQSTIHPSQFPVQLPHPRAYRHATSHATSRAYASAAHLTFIAVPFYADPKPDRPLTYLTPANQRTDISARPDIHRQTTTGDLAEMLEMIYTCVEYGRSPLLTLYPNEITQEECRDMLAMLELNDLVKLLEAGLPPGTVIAHKLGYVDETYGDAAIIYSPARTYILVLALYAPGWLEWDIASPLFARISALAYAHFNDPAALILRKCWLPHRR